MTEYEVEYYFCDENDVHTDYVHANSLALAVFLVLKHIACEFPYGMLVYFAVRRVIE